MQDGWKRRREMEALIGHEALRRAGSPRRTRGDPLTRVVALARRGGDDALEELEAIIDGSEDELRFAARVAFRRVARQERRAVVESLLERGSEKSR